MAVPTRGSGPMGMAAVGDWITTPPDAVYQTRGFVPDRIIKRTHYKVIDHKYRGSRNWAVVHHVEKSHRTVGHLEYREDCIYAGRIENDFIDLKRGV